MGGRVRAVLFIAINVACAAFVSAGPCSSGSGGGGTIEGTVFQLKGTGAEPKPYFGFRIQAVHLLSGKARATDITDERGYFRLRVPAGMYRIEPDTNEYLKIAGNSDDDSVEVVVEDSKCVFRALHVTNNSFISGAVLDEDGKKISAYRVELITVRKSDGDREVTSPRVSPDGFRFEQIPPAAYLLSFNYRSRPDDDLPYPTWFYPGTLDRAKATVFRIEEGTMLPPLVFKLPPKLQKVSLTGLVVWKDGRPAAGVELQLIDLESDQEVFSKEPVTDKNGYFALEAFADRRYKIEVIAWEERPDGWDNAVGKAETVEFVLGASTPALRIELQTVDPEQMSRQRKKVGN